MDDDLSEDALLERERLAEEVDAEAQQSEAIEKSFERIEKWEEDYFRTFGCWPEEWMCNEFFESDVQAGYVDPPIDNQWDMLFEIERRLGLVTVNHHPSKRMWV